MTEIITVEDLSFQYKRGKEAALRRINFSVTEGEFVGITGPAGAGKTTLLSCLNGISLTTMVEASRDVSHWMGSKLPKLRS